MYMFKKHSNVWVSWLLLSLVALLLFFFLHLTKMATDCCNITSHCNRRRKVFRRVCLVWGEWMQCSETYCVKGLVRSNCHGFDWTSDMIRHTSQVQVNDVNQLQTLTEQNLVLWESNSRKILYTCNLENSYSKCLVSRGSRRLSSLC